MIGPIAIGTRVAAALTAGRPVVALESTIITHGFPRPENLAMARRCEEILEAQGVTPATVAVIEGRPTVGLEAEQLASLAENTQAVKVSSRDLPVAMALRVTGGTTVAATATLAAAAGIRVFATGGVGGVHRRAGETFDESADLVVLSRHPVTVVAAGVKSILDVAATLERLETLDVTVVGYRTHRFPEFWMSDSGHALEWRLEGPEAVVKVMASSDALGRRGAIIVANPLPESDQMDRALHDRVLEEALRAARQAGVLGRDVTPFLLNHFLEATGGSSLTINTAIVTNNTRVAGEIAVAWAAASSAR